MYMLLCKHCSEVISLSHNTKKCSCGSTEGKYINDVEAEYSGPAIPFELDNKTFIAAAAEFDKVGEGMGFVGFVIGSDCKTLVKK